MIADRIYGTIRGIEFVRANGANFVMRFRSKAFNLYSETGEKIELLKYLRPLKTQENASMVCYYKISGGELCPIRIVAMKKDAKSIKESKRSKKQQKATLPETIELNEYVVLATSLDYTNDQILELYRARWQIEEVFYRLKSLFGYGEVPSKNPETVKAWFYGKLFLAALCEKILKVLSFSPKEQILIADIVAAKLVE